MQVCVSADELSEQVIHAVKAGGLAHQKANRPDGPNRKDGAGLSDMSQLDHLDVYKRQILRKTAARETSGMERQKTMARLAAHSALCEDDARRLWPEVADALWGLRGLLQVDTSAAPALMLSGSEGALRADVLRCV